MAETIRLLVTDDESLERAVIIETINSDVRCDENYHIRVFQAQDGNEAMRIFSQQDISAAFLD